MPIPFRDADALEDLGAAAYLELLRGPDGASLFGALFLMNARGEPLELVYNRVALPRSPLWRPTDLGRAAQRTLTVSLLELARTEPRLMLCLADHVDWHLFCGDIQLSLPAARLARPLTSTAIAPAEVLETLTEPERVDVYWASSTPLGGSPPRRIFDHLASTGLLLEPFIRARIALSEVYPEESIPEHSP